MYIISLIVKISSYEITTAEVVTNAMEQWANEAKSFTVNWNWSGSDVEQLDTDLISYDMFLATIVSKITLKPISCHWFSICPPNITTA